MSLAEPAPRPMAAAGLARLFAPRSVAVLGASEAPGSVGSQVIGNLLHHGYAGRILPINPKYRRVHGLDCLPDIAALPETPDLLAVALPARLAPEAVAAAGRRGIPFAIVFASGFAEAGRRARRCRRSWSGPPRRTGCGCSVRTAKG